MQPNGRDHEFCTSIRRQLECYADTLSYAGWLLKNVRTQAGAPINQLLGRSMPKYLIFPLLVAAILFASTDPFAQEWQGPRVHMVFLDYDAFHGQLINRCASRFPETVQSLQTAIAQWRQKNQPALQELRVLLRNKMVREGMNKKDVDARLAQSAANVTQFMIKPFATMKEAELGPACSGYYTKGLGSPAMDYVNFLEQVKTELKRSNESRYVSSKGEQEIANHHEERQVLRLKEETSGPGSITSVAWSPDGSLIAASGSSLNVTVWDARSLSVIRALDQGFKGHGENNIAFSPNGRFLASGLITVNLWDAASGKPINTLIAPHITPGIPQVINVQALAFSPDSHILVVGYYGDKRLVIAFRVDDGKILWTYELQRVIGIPLMTTPIAFSADGKSVILGTGESGGPEVNLKPLSRVLFLNAESGALIRSIDDIHVMHPTTLAISQNGRWIATGTSTGVKSSTSNMTTKQVVNVDNRDPVRIWDIATGKLFRELPVGSRVWSLAFSHDDKYVFGAKSERSHLTLAVWDIESGRMVQEIRSNPGPMGLAISPDGRRLAAASQSKLAIYEIMTDQ
ncbi:MAG: PD40 domain-containing protein [Betaproteobacteria bacterium]|nr:PD40 domain-containing protein [Betaproteobacteria bacterium]